MGKDKIDYFKIIKQRKKFILLFATIFTVIILFVLFMNKMNMSQSAFSVISLGGEKGDRTLVMRNKLILESPDVLNPVKNELYDDFSLESFKKKHIEVEFIKERIHRTQEEVGNFLALTVKAENYAKAKQMNDMIVEQFFMVAESPDENNITLEKINILEEQRDGVKHDILMIESILKDTASDIEFVEEMVSDLTENVNYYVNFFHDPVGKKAYATLDYYPLLRKKLQNDLDDFKDTVVKAKEAQWTYDEREDVAKDFTDELNDYITKLDGKNVTGMDINEFILLQNDLLNDISIFRQKMLRNDSEMVFDGEESVEKLLELRVKLKEAEFEKQDFYDLLNDKKDSIRIISSPTKPGFGFSSVSEAIVKVTSGDDEFYNLLEAKNILISSEVLLPVIEKNYGGDMTADDLRKMIEVETIEMLKKGRETLITPFLIIKVSGKSPEKSQKVLNDLINSLFRYLKEYKNYHDDVSLIEEKIHFKENEVNNFKTDILLFEQNINASDYNLLRKIPLIKLKLLLSDYNAQLSDFTEQRIELQNELNSLASFGLINSPAGKDTIRYSPSFGETLNIFVGIIAGLLLAIFLAIGYEVYAPEIKKNYGKLIPKSKKVKKPAKNFKKKAAKKVKKKSSKKKPKKKVSKKKTKKPKKLFNFFKKKNKLKKRPKKEAELINRIDKKIKDI